MEDCNRGKANKATIKKEEMTFEKYGERLKNQLESISKLIARKQIPKKEEELSPSPQFNFKKNHLQRDKPSNNSTVPAQSGELSSRGSKDSGNQSKRSFIYDTQSFKDEPVNQDNLPKNNQIFQKIFKGKSPYSETMSTASSHIIQKQFEGKPSVVITDFVIGKKLGSGKFGEVFIAKHKITGFVCALKKISKADMNPKILVQLIRQIKIQSFLSHPNIVKLYTFFADEKFIYLVQQLCASGQLYSLLKRKRKLGEQLAKVILQQICKALDYMHECQIIHRDLKPENIIFHNGLIKICDFGWSISSKAMRETFCGTPLYVSPELLKRKNYNNKIDVWSVGVLTYELLFGRVPFEIVTEKDFIKIIQDEIKFSKATTISEEAKDFILVCLKKDPRDRYTVPQLLEHPFISIIQSPTLAELF